METDAVGAEDSGDVVAGDSVEDSAEGLVEEDSVGGIENHRWKKEGNSHHKKKKKTLFKKQFKQRELQQECREQPGRRGGRGCRGQQRQGSCRRGA